MPGQFWKKLEIKGENETGQIHEFMRKCQRQEKRQDGRYKDRCEAFCLASPTVGYYSINIKMINEGRHQKNKAENQMWIHQRCHKAVLLH